MYTYIYIYIYTYFHMYIDIHIQWVPAIKRNCLMKTLRLHFFGLLSKAAKKLRLSQAQTSNRSRSCRSLSC